MKEGKLALGFPLLQKGLKNSVAAIGYKAEDISFHGIASGKHRI
jgi:hypothetical protein